MLSLFPYLLSYEQVAPLLLRVTLGVVLIFWSIKRFKQQKENLSRFLSAIELLTGVLLIIGLFTQPSALVSAIILFVQLICKAQKRALFTSGVNYYFILFIISISILVLGPGFLSFDLPL